MPKPTLDIHSVQFVEDGLVVQYMEVPTDVRVRGRVVQTRMLHLNTSHPDYEEDREDLLNRVRAVVRNAMEDFNESEPYEPGVPDDEGDDPDRGMGE